MNITLKITRSRLLVAFGTLTLLVGLGLIASRPAHTAGGPIAVTVSNVPLTTKPTDGAPTQPFQAHTLYSFSSGSDTAFLYSGSKDITVPAGKRLIIQNVSLYEGVASGQTLQAYLATTVNNDSEYYALPSVPDNGTLYPGIMQTVTLSADAGDLTWTVYRSGTTGTNYVYLTVYGYLVNA